MTPLAKQMLIGALCAMNGQDSFVPSSPNQRDWAEAVEFAKAEGLVEGTGGPLTPRGHAYLDMILATPLPVQQWVDPRYRMTEVDVNGPVAAQRVQLLDGDGKSLGPDWVVQKAQPDIPEGFIPWPGGDTFPPELADPQTETIGGKAVQTFKLRAGQYLAIIRRSGKTQRLAAVSVNWKHAGPNAEGKMIGRPADDVIAFKPEEEPEEFYKR